MPFVQTKRMLLVTNSWGMVKNLKITVSFATLFRFSLLPAIITLASHAGSLAPKFVEVYIETIKKFSLKSSCRFDFISRLCARNLFTFL